MASLAEKPKAVKASAFRTPCGSPADVFKVLSDPIRLTMLGLLKKGELCERDLDDITQMLPRELLSQHLGVLQQLGLVKTRRDKLNPRWVYYSIDKEVLAEIGRYCKRLFDVAAIEEPKEYVLNENPLYRMVEAAAR